MRPSLEQDNECSCPLKGLNNCVRIYTRLTPFEHTI